MSLTVTSRRDKAPAAAQRVRTIAVVTNPSADHGKGRVTGEKALRCLREACGRIGCRVIDLTGNSRQDSLRRVRSMMTSIDALVVVGGDGMVSLGVNVVADCDMPLGIIPCGSGNDFVRGLGYPIGNIDLTSQAIASALYHHSSVHLDLGHAVSAEDDGNRFNTFFAGMLNCSIDAAINDRANHSQLPFGGLRYLEAGIWEATHVQDYGFHVEAHHANGTVTTYDLLTPLVVIANARYIGSGIEASPDSRLDDGLLEMLWAKWRPSGIRALKILAKAYRGKHATDPLIGYRSLTGVTINYGAWGAEPPVLMADGEKIGKLPVHVDVHPKALRLLVPPRVKQQWQSAAHVDTAGWEKE